MADVISHQASECTVCKDYTLHISEVLMDNDNLYLNSIDKWESNWIPMHEHQHELQHSARLDHDLEDSQEEINALRRHIMELEATCYGSGKLFVSTTNLTYPN
jgi:hypothetical protein